MRPKRERDCSKKSRNSPQQQKNALFAMQNKPVFDVGKSTAASWETHGKRGSRSEPRTR
jgi:hypothetical protein